MIALRHQGCVVLSRRKGRNTDAANCVCIRNTLAGYGKAPDIPSFLVQQPPCTFEGRKQAFSSGEDDRAFL